MPQRPPKNLAEQAAMALIDDGVKPMKATWMAAQICANLWALSSTWKRLGRMPTQLEYCEEWNITERTAQRYWAEIKRAFPNLPVPERQTVEYLTRHVVLHSREHDDQSAALAIEPIDGVAAFA